MAAQIDFEIWSKTEFRIEENGTYRFWYPFQRGASSFSAEWRAEGINPAGVLSLSYDGNYGLIEAVLDMSASENAVMSNMTLPFIDIEVSGLPAGGSITFYAR